MPHKGANETANTVDSHQTALAGSLFTNSSPYLYAIFFTKKTQKIFSLSLKVPYMYLDILKNIKSGYFGIFFLYCELSRLTHDVGVGGHAILFTGNYCLFAHSEVSNRFNWENDKVVLE